MCYVCHEWGGFFATNFTNFHYDFFFATNFTNFHEGF